uniref:Uncharacterized protein n=1 Tax=Leptocylindrus danicus TaxID=163516 RepID=A0A7S2LKI2_9STRA
MTIIVSKHRKRMMDMEAARAKGTKPQNKRLAMSNPRKSIDLTDCGSEDEYGSSSIDWDKVAASVPPTKASTPEKKVHDPVSVPPTKASPPEKEVHQPRAAPTTHPTTPTKKVFNPYKKMPALITPQKPVKQQQQSLMSELTPEEAWPMRTKEQSQLSGEDHMTHTAVEFTQEDYREHEEYFAKGDLECSPDFIYVGSAVSTDVREACINLVRDMPKLMPDSKGVKLIYFMSGIRSQTEAIDETSKYFCHLEESDDEEDSDSKVSGGGRGSGGAGVADDWSPMLPDSTTNYLRFVGLNSPCRLTDLFEEDVNGKFVPHKRPQSAPFMLIPRVGDDYTGKNAIGLTEFTMEDGKRVYRRSFYQQHIQSRNVRQGEPPSSFLELGAEYCLETLRSDLISSQADALANMACYNVDGGNICGNYKGRKVFPFTVYNRYISHIAEWMSCPLVKYFKIIGFEPVFMFHNILIVPSKHVKVMHQLATVNHHNTTHIGLMGFFRGRNKDPAKRVFVSACINGKIPQLLFE